jgi:hypothetical protein
MKKLVFSVVLGATILTTGAGAQTAPAETGGQKDREISRQQALQFADGMFQRFDLNHDGVITREEAEQARAQMAPGGGKHGAKAEKMIDRIFGTSQSVTKAQFEAMSLARFDSQDANHDGIVTTAEREQARAARQAHQ